MFKSAGPQLGRRETSPGSVTGGGVNLWMKRINPDPQKTHFLYKSIPVHFSIDFHLS